MAYNNSVSDVTGHTPFFLHYGRRARLPIARLLQDTPLLDDRLKIVADALAAAAEGTKNARHYNRERLRKKANIGHVQVGDTVVIKAAEPLSLSSTWDPQWTVTKVRKKVVWLVHQQTNKQKTLNINKIRVVDPNLIWDELHPRPLRQQRALHDRRAALRVQPADPNKEQFGRRRLAPKDPTLDPTHARAPATKRRRSASFQDQQAPPTVQRHDARAVTPPSSAQHQGSKQNA